MAAIRAKVIVGEVVQVKDIQIAGLRNSTLP